MQISVRNPELLPPAIRQELDSVIASLQAWSEQNHNADGTHGNIVSSGDISATGMATFVGQPRCRLFKDANQTISDTTETLLTWTQPTIPQGNVEEEYNIGGLFDVAVSDTNVIIREAGLYHIETMVTWAASAAGGRTVSIQYNGDEVAPVFGFGSTGRCQVSIILWCKPGDRLNVEASQTSGGDLDVEPSAATWFAVHKIG